ECDRAFGLQRRPSAFGAGQAPDRGGNPPPPAARVGSEPAMGHSAVERTLHRLPWRHEMRPRVALMACVALLSSALWASAQEPIQPIKAVAVTNPALVELGKKLYFDPRLSKSG